MSEEKSSWNNAVNNAGNLILETYTEEICDRNGQNTCHNIITAYICM